jgi:Flp pilus assembly protein TadG
MLIRLRRFLAEQSGAYAPLFAILSVPLFGTAAAAVEYSRVLEAQFQLQHALDAAALATAKELAKSVDQKYLQQYARDFFDANLDATLDPAEVNFTFQMNQGQSGGSNIKVSANYNYKTVMAGVIGVDDIDMTVRAEVAAGNRTVEVAIVMDNSGSMSTMSGWPAKSRLARSQEAASALIDSLHAIANLSNKPDPVKIGIVPFGGSVNVGPQYRGANWMDMKGFSSIHHENLDWLGAKAGTDPWPDAQVVSDGFKSASTNWNEVGPNPPDPLPPDVVAVNSNWLTRWTLYDRLNIAWKGCVEMRPWPFNETDAGPNDMSPDSLFVPMFAPDEPERVANNEDYDYQNEYLNDFKRPGGTNVPTDDTNSGSTSKQHIRQSWTNKYTPEALLVSGGKIRAGTKRSNDIGDYGPNQGCTTNPLLPMTTVKQDALDSVSAMKAGGFTNVQEGIAWGWRILSPGAPFKEGRPYKFPENDKYLIVLTDGNNTYPGQSTLNETEYYAWGYGRDDRVMDNAGGAWSNTKAMDVHTAATCANIKKEKNADDESAIKIFTIAYDVPSGSSVKQLLYDCASTGRDGNKYYYDVQGSAIAAAMAAIGSEISDLRISK